MSLRIYFVRHGETTYSQTGGFCGAIDPELTPAGSQMAETVCRHLRKSALGGCLCQSDETHNCYCKTFVRCCGN
ncbi:histidine phosphatase family protein [Microcoleus vaginatus]|uniref:histidine phosphatase family protein n=1 Tax=Microcoleus vaginatus TaxID=119532 RepID=UPI00403FB287